MKGRMIFATANRNKLREAAEILGDGYTLDTPADYGLTEEIPETGDTIRANSSQKAEYIWNRLGIDCFADDTGLEVDALGGAPGVHTARYAGEEHDAAANTAKLLRKMDEARTEAHLAEEYGMKLRPMGRKARFRTVVTLILDGEKHCFEGIVEGRIALSPRGEGGFGYDPVFVPDEIPGEEGSLVPNSRGITFAEMSEEAKNSISHRGKAMRAMAEWLDKRQSR